MPRIIKNRTTHEQYFLIRKRVEEIGQEAALAMTNQELCKKLSDELEFDISAKTVGLLTRSLGWYRNSPNKADSEPDLQAQIKELTERVAALESRLAPPSQKPAADFDQGLFR
jgi:hypothetical protein